MDGQGLDQEKTLLTSNIENRSNEAVDGNNSERTDEDMKKDVKGIEEAWKKTLEFLPEDWRFLEQTQEMREQMKMIRELLNKKWDPTLETIWEHANRKYWITYRCQNRYPTVQSRSIVVKLTLLDTTTHFTNWKRNEKFLKIYQETRKADVSWREMRDRLMELEKEYRRQDSKWNENYLHEFETRRWNERKVTMLEFMKRKLMLFKLLYGDKLEPDKKAEVMKQMLINTMPDDKNHLREHILRDDRKQLKKLRGEELTEEEKHILPLCCRPVIPNTKRIWTNEVEEEETDAEDEELDSTTESDGEYEEDRCHWCDRRGHRVKHCKKAKIDGYLDDKRNAGRRDVGAAKKIAPWILREEADRIADIRKGRVFCLKCKQDGHYRSECKGIPWHAVARAGHKQKYVWDATAKRYRLNTTNWLERVKSDKEIPKQELKRGLQHWASNWDTHRESGSETD